MLLSLGRHAGNLPPSIIERDLEYEVGLACSVIADAGDVVATFVQGNTRLATHRAHSCLGLPLATAFTRLT